MQRWFWVVGVVALVLTFTACSKKNNTTAASATPAAHAASTAHTQAAAAGTNAPQAAATQAAVTATPIADASFNTTPVTKLVQDLRTSVVKVEASGTVQGQPGPFGAPGQPSQALGIGTGMILNSNGDILTNNHVVTLESANVASSLQVVLPDGKTVQAKLVGRDPQTDLAVISVPKSDVSGDKPIQWANPSLIVVGEPVVAIGYALDLSGAPTVTTGVVSATSRIIPESNGVTISDAIQTDAAINPGNSGGPLLDLNEHVIGVNTAGVTGTSKQPAQGINLAISVTTAQQIAADLIAHGKVTRGYMGVGVVNIDQQFAQANNLPVSSGAGIQQVVSGSPAAQAGLKPGDIIVKLGDTTINSSGDLTTALTKNGPGTKVPVTFYDTSGKQQTTQITLGQRPSGG